MPVQPRPNVESVWASQGNTSAPNQEKILEGWIEEIPLNIIANWIENRQDRAILYLFQNGIAEWHNATEYPKNCLTRQEGIFYISKEASTGASPKDTPIAWEIAFDKYGAAKAVMDVIEEIMTQEGKLTLYVSKKNPVMDNPATAPAFWAKTGRPSTVEEDTKVGFGFEDSKNSGMFKDASNNTSIYKEGIQVASFEDSEKDTDVITRGMLKDLLRPFELPVGSSLITVNPANPRTYFGYGTWVQDAQGRAIVGVSSSVTSDVPDWVKVVDTEFGEYDHKLTVEELPKHSHSIGGRWQDGGSGGVQGGNRSSANIVSTNETGGDSPHNNVQPSVTKFVWTRTA